MCTPSASAEGPNLTGTNDLAARCWRTGCGKWSDGRRRQAGCCGDGDEREGAEKGLEGELRLDACWRGGGQASQGKEVEVILLFAAQDDDLAVARAGWWIAQQWPSATRHTGSEAWYELGARRAGDPPILISIADEIRKKLNWTPKFDDLETIVRTALDWEYKLTENPGDFRK